jgi:hypothetical protein
MPSHRRKIGDNWFCCTPIAECGIMDPAKHITIRDNKGVDYHCVDLDGVPTAMRPVEVRDDPVTVLPLPP